MPHIVPAIACLEQHLKELAGSPETYRPSRCPKCGLAGLWCHGHYERKADRDTGKLNPVEVPRYICGKKGGCGSSCSSLPSCLCPRRWYDWAVQQAVLLLMLAGASIRSCAEELGRARSTVRRWWKWLAGRHEVYAFHLLTDHPEWGRVERWQEFWQRAMEEQPLAEPMAYLARAGLTVP